MNHYNQSYFDWQKKTGAFGGKINFLKFNKFIAQTDNVLEFGCGGGYLLNNIKCKDKIGIEINPASRDHALKLGHKVFEDVNKIEDNWADIIISNHVLEHTLNPLQELKNLKSKLKPSGKIIFVVPQEFKSTYKESDINQHLFTWTPANLGNLFKTAGYSIISVKTLCHRWPPFYKKIYQILGLRIFNLLCFLYCFLTQRGYQSVIAASND